jgi:hypothetical protein
MVARASVPADQILPSVPGPAKVPPPAGRGLPAKGSDRDAVPAGAVRSGPRPAHGVRRPATALSDRTRRPAVLTPG